jgi:hypothetical protein
VIAGQSGETGVAISTTSATSLKYASGNDSWTDVHPRKGKRGRPPIPRRSKNGKELVSKLKTYSIPKTVARKVIKPKATHP